MSKVNAVDVYEMMRQLKSLQYDVKNSLFALEISSAVIKFGKQANFI